MKAFAVRRAKTHPSRLGHRDPFDRTLAAQSLAEGLVLPTPHRAFRAFGVETPW
ncbi:hypothetical protein GCM10007092_14240 [Thermus composti]|uniref:PIN domain-containing protein n=1 Tax=Thermus composti TaxID=532059 RepID=A0ABV6Q1M6_9DEIN|nr:hypothetical protein [Thermus composti]GGN01338.1 hypothetical protein GCM10007092_14240 [Thermus composti]